MANPEMRVFSDAGAIAREAANKIVDIAKASIVRRGRFSIALSGGATPKKLYELLATDEFRDQIDWLRTDTFFSDERCVPPDHPESNYRMARQTLLSKVPIPGENVYRMRGEIDPPDAAKEYGLLLKEKFGDDGLDLILLCMGEDGHTASLFPGTKAVEETHHRVLANYAKNSTTGKSWRITMTAPFINKAANVFILVSGAAKAVVLKEVLEGPRDSNRFPVQLIRPNSGRIVWLIDAAAAGTKPGDTVSR